MTSKLSILVGVVLGIVLLSYMFVFQVKHDEVAVRTTFNHTEAPVRLTATVRAPDMPASQEAVSGDATFEVRINEQDPVQITVPAADLQDNAAQEDAMAAARDDLARAVAQAGLSNRLAVRVQNNRLELVIKDAGSDDKLAIPQADEATRRALGFDRHVARAGSLYDEPGLKFRLPYPIQKVYKYPRKLHVLEDQPQEVQINEQQSVIVRAYMTWRIAHPYQFYQNSGSVAEAENTLRRLMSETYGVFGDYDFGTLVNRAADASAAADEPIEQVEQAWLAALREELNASGNSGIEIEHVGIRRVMLPEQTTNDVFDAMRSRRQSMASSTIQNGEARATKLISEAEDTKRVILSFARSRAQQIRAEGDARAASHYATFAENPRLANFLRAIEALKQIGGHNSTYIFDASQVFMYEALIEDMNFDDPQVTEQAPPAQDTPAQESATDAADTDDADADAAAAHAVTGSDE